MRQVSNGPGQSKCESCLSKVQGGIQGFSSSAVLMIVAYEKCALTAEESSFQWEDFLAHQVM